MLEAVRVAVTYRTPVILLSDTFLANSSEPWRVPDAADLPEIDPRFATAPNRDGEFWPYLRDDRQARPWALPGTEGLQHVIGGLEKEADTGHISYEPDNHALMTRLRAEKIAGIAAEIPELEVDAQEGAEMLVLGWGSTYGAIKGAVRRVRKRGKKVAILEAGDGIPPNINDYMERFYKSSAKVPESPYTPPIFDEPARGGELPRSSDPRKIRAGRPTVLTVNAEDWANPDKSYLVHEQTRDGKKLMPFSSTYDRIAGGTSHWLGTCLRFVPNDFKMKSLYGLSEASFVDWPIGYEDLVEWYGKAEAELGVSADVEDQKYLGVHFPGEVQPAVARGTDRRRSSRATNRSGGR